jgi:hypothetical protein
VPVLAPQVTTADVPFNDIEIEAGITGIAGTVTEFDVTHAEQTVVMQPRTL